MEQRISLITLGVDDLSRSRNFFEAGLGWVPTGDYDDIAFYQLPGVALALFGRAALAADAHTTVDGRFSGVTIAVNQRSEADVDRVLAEATDAGATLVKAAVHTEWGGYSGYFADLDGHRWEVAHNPLWSLAGDGSLILA